MQKEAGPNVEKQIEKGYEMMLYKSLPKEKLTVFVDLYNEALTEFRSDGDKTKKLMGADSTGTYKSINCSIGGGGKCDDEPG